MSNIKVAIIHDFLLYSGGAEKILEQLLDIYPSADIFTLFHNKDRISKKINDRVKYVSILNNLPFVKIYYRYTLFLWPLVIEQYKLSNYDLVISISSGFSFGVITNSKTRHISIVLTPPRYINEQFFQYFKNKNILEYIIISTIILFLRIWEYTSSYRPDYIISISSLVTKRIKKYFRREPDITIYPPVDVSYSKNVKNKDNYYLSISPFKEYKGGELLIETAIKYSLNVIILEQNKIDRKIKNRVSGYSNIKIINDYVSEKNKWNYIAKAKGLIMCGIEEFGIVALEAISCGTPVIANKLSGTKDIINKSTGVLFNDFTSESIYEAVLKIENSKWDFNDMNRFAKQYSNDNFKKSIYNYINDIMSKKNSNLQN